MFKERPFLTVLMILSLLNISAQTWQWGKSGGSFGLLQNKEKVKSMVTDSEGNVYLLSVVGELNLTLDGIPQPSYGQRDYIMASFSCDGEFRWSHVIGSTSNDNISRIQIDSLGNIYVAGSIGRSSEAYIGLDTILPYSSQNNVNKESLYLIKYDSEGELQWLETPHASDVTSTESQGGSLSVDVQVDGAGNVYWLCIIPEGIYANGAFENTLEGENYFMFKYNSEGDFVEAYPINIGITIGNFYVMKRNHKLGITYITGFLEYGAEPLMVGNEIIEDGMYLSAFDEKGSLLWVKQNTVEDYYGTIQDMYIDNEHHIYLTGGSVNGDTMAGYTMVSSGVGVVPYIIKLNENGDFIWGTNGDTGGTSTVSYAIAVNNEEVGIALGSANMDWDDISIPIVWNKGFDVHLIRFDKAEGSLIGIDSLTSNFGAVDYASAICSDKLGNFYVGGWFKNILYIADEVHLNGADGWDFFIAKYGHDNCDCELPAPMFNAIVDDTDHTTFDFIYSSTIPYNSIQWDFGDGTTSSVENPIHSFSVEGLFDVCVTVSNDCGAEQYCEEISVVLVETVEEIVGNIKVYPNPVFDRVNVKTTERLSYGIYTILGTEVEIGEIDEGENTIITQHLQSGIYFLVIKSGAGQQQTIRLIKQ